LSGASNPFAKDFAEREHFDGVLLNFKNKNQAFDHILEETSFEAHEVAFFYDDILDLGVAARAGFRVFLGKDHSPSLKNFVYENELADYSTARPGGQNGLREACDFMLTATRIYKKVVEDRLSFSKAYNEYWRSRQLIETGFEQAQ
jgi:3-deoxy-D-manno-octulosonate 8-phosphate phosphatase (KDO 8-P phosphatase)